MSAPCPVEQILLKPAHEIIINGLNQYTEIEPDNAKLLILASAASKLGGFKPDILYRIFDDYLINKIDVERLGNLLVTALNNLPIHPSLSLAALANFEMKKTQRRANGVYFTDFRLANYLASELGVIKRKNIKILDPSCGSGILLSAYLIAISKSNKKCIKTLLSESIYGADLSPKALIGALISLSSLTNDVSVIKNIQNNLKCTDSLFAGLSQWSNEVPEGFDIIIGNPPWEKLKISRHEWLQSNGVKRHYGSAYDKLDFNELMAYDLNELASYKNSLKEIFHYQGNGEFDLYKLFVELSARLSKPGGRIGLLIPAGLIRSQGTSALRKHLFSNCSNLRFTIFENRAKYFGIDTRFKFLSFIATNRNGANKKPIELVYTKDDNYVVKEISKAFIGRSVLKKIREDLSIPEVKNSNEWAIFRDLSLKGIKFSDKDGFWQPDICREVEMTRDRPHFKSLKGDGLVPLIEGRMVHQYRYTAKKYISGTGRKAIWEPTPDQPFNDIQPQYYYPTDKLHEKVKERMEINRVGFCDITGQTNERTMLSAPIPAGIVCGNKVPTILFSNYSDQIIFNQCWLAITNSIPFDWLLRKVITTTLNYFILFQMPMPNIDPLSKEGQNLAKMAGHLVINTKLSPWEKAELRAEIDLSILSLFGHDTKTMEIMMKDFKLLDRSQLPIRGEQYSTVTTDFLLHQTAVKLGGASKSKIDYWQDRYLEARSIGATAYIPTDLD